MADGFEPGLLALRRQRIGGRRAQEIGAQPVRVGQGFGRYHPIADAALRQQGLLELPVAARQAARAHDVDATEHAAVVVAHAETAIGAGQQLKPFLAFAGRTGHGEARHGQLHHHMMLRESLAQPVPDVPFATVGERSGVERPLRRQPTFGRRAAPFAIATPQQVSGQSQPASEQAHCDQNEDQNPGRTGGWTQRLLPCACSRCIHLPSVT